MIIRSWIEGYHKKIFCIFAVLISLPCMADHPKENFRNEIHLQEKGITVINLPYSKYSELGKIEVVNNSDSTIVYTLDFFLRFENYFSKDATYHVQVNDWFLSKYLDEVVLTFYEKDKVIRNFRFDELNVELRDLIKTVSHTIWEKQSFLKDNHFYLLTTNNELMVFDITTGDLLRHERNISSSKYNSQKKKSDLYSVSYSDEYPEIYNLKTNQNQDLRSILSDLVFKYLPDTKEFIWIGVYVFKNGSLAVRRVEGLNDFSNIKTISSEIKRVRLTDIDFPNGYYKWGKMIKLEKKKIVGKDD